MKPMEAVFIFTGIMILLMVVVIVYLGTKAITTSDRKQEKEEMKEEKEDPCIRCLRWSECNGVDEDCPWRV